METKIKELRKQKGMSRQELSEKTGINSRTLESYEQGRKDINGAKLKTLLKLCATLNCNLGDILEDEELIEMVCKYLENGKEAKNEN